MPIWIEVKSTSTVPMVDLTGRSPEFQMASCGKAWSLPAMAGVILWRAATSPASGFSIDPVHLIEQQRIRLDIANLRAQLRIGWSDAKIASAVARLRSRNTSAIMKSKCHPHYHTAECAQT